MSKFFRRGSSSESENEENNQEEDTGIRIPSKYAKTTTDEFSSEDEGPKKRVVRSAKEKILEDLNNTVVSIKNAMKTNDWTKISSDWDKLNKQLQTQKVQQFLQKEGQTTPRLFLKTVIMLEESAKTALDSAKTKGTKMSSNNSKALNAMKQKLKKVSKQYEKEIEEYKKVPDVSGDEEESESQEWNPDEDSEEEIEPEAPITQTKEEISEEEGSSEEESEEEATTEAKKPSKWFVSGQKQKVTAPEKKKKDETLKKPKAPGEVKQVEKKEEKPVEMTPEEVKARLKDILQARGKRGTDSVKQIEKLQDLLPYAKEPELQVEIMIHLVSSQFDVNKSAASHLPLNLWKGALNNLTTIVTVLEKNPTLVLQESEKEREDSDGDDEEEGEQKQVQGNLMAFIQRLDDEFNKSLQSIDPHTQEYVQRLQDENIFLELAARAQTYYERIGQPKPAAKIAARRVEHIYYKLDAHYAKQTVGDVDLPKEEKKEEKLEEKSEVKEQISSLESLPKVLKQAIISSVDNKELLERLAHLIYNFGDERMKTRTMLCHIYYHAIHDRFYEARDMMLMSHLQETVTHTDINTQILFNRTMVQLGLCAFRNGLIKQAHSCLVEIYSGGKVKELLAQGVTSSRYSEKTQEQEKLERKRQLPYHMHINLELLEGVHLICALLLEVPNMAANQYDPKKKIINRNFRRLLDNYDRSVFVGPPENTRDVIITASKALSKGDWKKCEVLLLELPIWNLVSKGDQVKVMLRRKIQEEGLRTYIFAYNSFYDSMSLEQLSKLFELPKNTVHSIVSKMMISEELHASWDQPTGAIVMHKVEPTKLQYLAMQFADRAAAFVENNERLLDSRMGGYSGYKFDQKTVQQKERWQDGRSDGRTQKESQRRGRDNKGQFTTFQNVGKQKQGGQSQGSGRDSRSGFY